MKNCAFETCINRLFYFFMNPQNSYNPVHPRPIKSLFSKKNLRNQRNLREKKAEWRPPVNPDRKNSIESFMPFYSFLNDPLAKLRQR